MIISPRSAAKSAHTAIIGACVTAVFGVTVVMPDRTAAHEFWLEPVSYQVATGETIEIETRNGQDFEGINLSWFDRRIDRVTFFQDGFRDGKAQRYTGTPGDLPSISLDGVAGLTSVAYASTMSTLTYESWEKVMGFIAHKDAPWFEAEHNRRGLPRTKVREGYWRFSKTLVAAGDGAGRDQLAGFETEFLAMTNPYAAEFDGEMQVQLIYQGHPRANAQVEIWRKPLADNPAPDPKMDATNPDTIDAQSFTPDTVIRDITRTDAKGQLRFSTQPGYAYQLDAVVIREPGSKAAKKADVMWETLWANMTFGTPITMP